jgi:LPXTG-motif cell wall-anchored protein
MKNKTIFTIIGIAGVAAIGVYLYKKNENKMNATGGGIKKISVIPPKPSLPCAGGWELHRQFGTGKWVWICKYGIGDVQQSAK